MKVENMFQDLQRSLADMIGSLDPVPYQPTESAEYDTVTFDGTEKDNRRWKALLRSNIASATKFEIHCWSEETTEINLALQYGSIKPMPWKFGTVIEGNVTPEFIDMLLSLPKPPLSSNGYNMMTPFFTVIFDNGFSSNHYGTENHFQVQSSKQGIL